MAVFSQRSELSRQGRHIPASWDDSFGLKLLGYNERGGNNLWGSVLNFIPGVNTGRHALAMGTSSGDTKKVLKDTFDEAIAQDFATLAFGVDVAKTALTAGAGGAGGLSLGGGKMGSVLASKGASGAMEAAASGVNAPMDFGSKLAEVGKMTGDTLESDMFSDVQKKVGENITNPYEPGTAEYDAFEKEKKNQFGSGVKEQFGDFLGSAGSGNIFSSGANLLATTIDNYKTRQSTISDYARGTMVDESPFNYLY